MSLPLQPKRRSSLIPILALCAGVALVALEWRNGGGPWAWIGGACAGLAVMELVRPKESR